MLISPEHKTYAIFKQENNILMSQDLSGTQYSVEDSDSIVVQQYATTTLIGVVTKALIVKTGAIVTCINCKIGNLQSEYFADITLINTVVNQIHKGTGTLNVIRSTIASGDVTDIMAENSILANTTITGWIDASRCIFDACVLNPDEDEGSKADIYHVVLCQYIDMDTKGTSQVFKTSARKAEVKAYINLVRILKHDPTAGQLHSQYQQQYKEVLDLCSKIKSRSAVYWSDASDEALRRIWNQLPKNERELLSSISDLNFE